MSHVGWAEEEDRGGNRQYCAERARVLLHMRPFDTAAMLDRVAFLDCALHELSDEHWRVGRESGALRFDGADNRSFERWLVLFEIERNLLIGHTAQLRLDQEDIGDQPHDERHDD